MTNCVLIKDCAKQSV